jgi:hypothetical protein
MRHLLCLLLMGCLVAQDLPNGENQKPIMKKPFHLSYDDISEIDTTELRGKVLVKFSVDKNGKIVEPYIIDTFNIALNETIISKVMAIEFEPAKQNGIPVRVNYQLPILFK